MRRTSPCRRLAPGRARVRLDFGEARPIPDGGPRARLQAWVEAPVREAAVVYVNDRRAGSVFCPPYSLDVSDLLRRGENRFESSWETGDQPHGRSFASRLPPPEPALRRAFRAAGHGQGPARSVWSAWPDSIDRKMKPRNTRNTRKWARVLRGCIDAIAYENKMKITLKVLLILAVAGILSQAISIMPAAAPNAAINLAGTWRFALDRMDSGVKEQWFGRICRIELRCPDPPGARLWRRDQHRTPGFTDYTTTSGIWCRSKAYAGRQRQGSFPQPPPRHYLGAARYQRDIESSASWQRRRVVLTLERPRWETAVWLDETKIGSCNSLVAPTCTTCGILTPGRHRRSIREDNRMILPYRPDAIAYPSPRQ